MQRQERPREMGNPDSFHVYRCHRSPARTTGLVGTNSERQSDTDQAPLPRSTRAKLVTGSVHAGASGVFCNCFLTVSILDCGPRGTLPTTLLSQPEPSHRHQWLQESRPHTRRRRPRQPTGRSLPAVLTTEGINILKSKLQQTRPNTNRPAETAARP